MDSTLKQRLIGAAVLAALAVIFLPMLLKGPDVKEPDAAEVPLTMPATPGQEFETRELTLTEPDGAAPPGGVLGMAPAAPAAIDAADATIPPPGEATAAADVPVDGAPAAVATAPAATTPAAADAKSSAATVGAGNYAVNVGSFSNPETANALATKLRAVNLPVTTDQIALVSGSATRLRVGPYLDRASAEAARLRAEGVTGGTANVVVLDAKSTSPDAQKVAATQPVAAKAPAAAVKPAASPTTSPTASPAKSPTPASAEPAMPSAAGFAVQLSAPSVEADALALRDRARAAGFSSFVRRIETDSGARFRVRVGPVADRSAAEALRDSANAKLGTKGIIVTNP